MSNLKIGSTEHRDCFCRVFIDTHVPFKAEDIAFPELDAESLVRLKSLPVWNEAVRTESMTAVKVQTLGKVEPDPVLAEAIALQGYEEGRHAAVLERLTAHYGIPVTPFEREKPPRNPTWTFLRTGYGECMDSFFAFGLFEIGRRSQFFPAGLTEIFEGVMQEEARHVLFLVNWAAYERIRAGSLRRPLFDLRRAWNIASVALEHVRTALTFGSGDSQKGFSMKSQSSFGEISGRSFLELCLSENDRRLSLYDPRLLRPSLVPKTARLALRLLSRGGHGAQLSGTTPQPPGTAHEVPEGLERP
jgi:hypothetical protein